MEETFSIENSMKSIFITGGTTGIGAALADYYMRQGWVVGICGRNKQKFLENFTHRPDNLIFYEVDVTDRELFLSNMKEFISEHGLDVMVANAGISMGSKTPIPDFDRARRVFDVNVYGVLNAYESCLEYFMEKRQGHLVCISSVAAYVGLPGTAAYCGSKAAVLKLSESLAVDLKAYGITVSTVCPGFIDTPLTKTNKHPMPFLMSSDKAAKLIANSIEHKKELYVFPLRMNIIIEFLSRLPRWIYRGLFRKKAFNYSEK